MSVVRNALAIVMFAIAGMCVITAQMMAFMKLGHTRAMLVFVAVLFVLSAVFLAAGAFAGAFRPRARGAGIALLIASATTAFGVIGWVTLLLAPGIVDVMQQQGVDVNARMFRFAPGAGVTGLSALVGVWLARRG
ncbi:MULTISPECIES: hypothetical protein [Burkholderia]|uniref:Transmembrane protein n=1 Tax=Burkholderia cepacia TaxID=292 RepID=A0ABM6NS93_BURCE|nr:hypothetical protein [Burkholderia cepacia]AIO23909.1 putative membrane protein [Burkholderia cepacia ATCC 25416]ALK16789.1 hypothetical protein APZ15_02595 [Burkholderia cepacia ATCC 25416]ASE94594.1 hypothetical protein CEQ23_13915 [Burkholderia cepacia]ATF77229.1 hypothetical protein CO711_07070 [Burkholderia cepacia]MCA7895801.1 hypothetical protein [Burkholderia cepacia]